MNSEINTNNEHWFDSMFLAFNESHQLDLRRILSPDTCELIHTLSDYYMYDHVALFLHILGLTSHYLNVTPSFVYADNQLKHKLNLHLMLIVRSGYERSSLIEHVKQCMINVHSIRQNIQLNDHRNSFQTNLFCRTDNPNSSTSSFCISDRFDQHANSSHIQHHQTSSILGISDGEFLEKRFQNKNHHSNESSDWLMFFIASKTRLYCHRLKVFDPNRYPSLEQCVMVIHCLCSSPIDFFFDEPYVNQFMCDYLDALTVKAVSLETQYPWVASRYISAQEQVLRISACLRLIELSIETLVVYKRTFHSFGQPEKIFYEDCMRLINQTRSGTTGIVRLNINLAIVQSAIYLVNNSVKQYEILVEPSINSSTPVPDLPMQNNPSYNPERSWGIPSSSSSSSTSLAPLSTSPTPSKRLKTFSDPSYSKSLELSHELLLLPYVAFTRTSLYANSKLKRNAAFLDHVIDELKKHQLLNSVRQGVQMVDGTRRRVDLLVKAAPLFKEDENRNTDKQDQDLLERLNRFSVDYDRYIQTLANIDIGEKYRLSDQCFDLLNSPKYKRYLTIDLERIAPLHRIQQQDETEDQWPSRSSSIKLEPSDLYI